MSTLIGLDLGTSAIKGVLTDDRGHVLAEAGSPVELLHPQAGWVEIDPERRYRQVCDILRRLAAGASGQVSAVAMAVASGNTLLTTDDGIPLANIISWMDGRAAREPLAALAGLTGEEVRQITGWPCITAFPLAHLAWLLEHRPDLYRRAGHYGMDTDWLLYRLTGRWRMDHSTAATFHLQEQVRGTYYQPFLQRLAITQEKLSKLADSGTAVGPLTARAADDAGLAPGTTVVAGCFDHPAAARAAGILTPGQLLLSCGTSWVGFTPCPDRRRILDAGLLCDPFLSETGGPWGGIFSIPYIGQRIDWYIDNIIAPGESDRIRIFNDFAAEADPGAGGLEIDLRQAPCLIRDDRKNVSRAVMEGAARLLHRKIAELSAHGFLYERAVMAGGPSESPIWPLIVAEITGIDVSIAGRSAGARGAAMLAGIGAGIGDVDQVHSIFKHHL